MKPSRSLLLITVLVCFSFIHAAPISRKSHTITEPLGFLTNFILNKRARAVNGEVGLQTSGATKRASVIPETPFIAAASMQIHVKAEPENRENEGTQNQVQDGDTKPFIDSANSRSSSTNEASTWNWWQLNNKKSSENSDRANPVGHRDIIKLSFRNEANIARRATGTVTVDTTPVDFAEVPIVDALPIEEVQVDVVDTVVQDAVAELAGASATSTDGSFVSVATTTAPKTIKKEASLKILANPKHHFLYEDNTPNFRVTLQVIEVEFDADHTKPVSDAAAVDVKPTEIASSAATSAAGTGETSAVWVEADAIVPVVAISATSGVERTHTESVSFGSVLQNLASGGYVSQSSTVIAEASQTVGGTGAAGGTEVAEGTGFAGAAGGTGIVGETEVADGIVVAGGTGVTGDEESANQPKVEPKNGNRGRIGTESDSSEEDD